jgi:hypothetical protein
LIAAVSTVIEQIKLQLIEDVPGVSGQEYFDYPGDYDPWLASLEPSDPCDPYWMHITDLSGIFPSDDVSIEIVNDNTVIELNDPNNEHLGPAEQLADADGDGVGDSKWMKLEDVMTSKGRPIFAAVRIVDNGGMLNVNTAYRFDPHGEPNKVDGLSQTQIDLFALSKRGSTSDPLGKLDSVRFGSETGGLDDYIEDVVWHYGEPDGLYTPFDISDELKLRYRYMLNYRPVFTRIEELWYDVYDSPPFVPRTNKKDWFGYANSFTDPNDSNESGYDYRHISTTYNMDRIIRPNGRNKMMNLNRAGTRDLYNLLVEVVGDANDAAQTAVNLVDFRDGDSQVTLFDPGEPNDPNEPSGNVFYGFEGPCVYISELAHHFKTPDIFPGPASLFSASYAIELYKPYLGDSYPEPNQWRLNITNSGYLKGPININWSGTKRFHLLLFEDPCAPLQPIVNFDPNDEDPCLPCTYELTQFGPGNFVFREGSLIELQRLVGDVNDPVWVTVDSVRVPEGSLTSGWLMSNTVGVTRAIQRNINPHKCIRRLWASSDVAGAPELGHGNSYFGGGAEVIQAYPANEGFINVGQIGLVFRKGAYYEDASDRDDSIGYSLGLNEEDEVRIDLTDSVYQDIFNHLTVLDPSVDGINNDDDGKTASNPDGWVDGDDRPNDPNTVEWKIPGRININTAPMFVIAQLPWMKCTADTVDYSYDDPNQFERAQAICDYRDGDTVQGFRNIGELMNVEQMLSFGGDGEDNLNGDSPSGPDLTSDSARDDFEERDLLFTRVSNLVTVRSDVFTAYILVRIGTDGPLKRAIVTLDRSGVYPTESGEVEGEVRIIARQPVPDPKKF